METLLKRRRAKRQWFTEKEIEDALKSDESSDVEVDLRSDSDDGETPSGYVLISVAASLNPDPALDPDPSPLSSHL
jgi:hypothetical protein